MGRSPCCDANGLKRGPWTPEEDQKLFAYIQKHGHGSWSSLPEKAGLQRCGKSCRLRWINYLRPDIKRGKFSLQEQKTIIQLHAFLGNRWSAIASHLPNRTDNEIKNYWNTHIKKRLTMMGIDPATHKPMAAALGSANGDPKKVSHLTHMAQWESARLEAEARLVKESTKLRQNDPQQQPAGFPKPAFPTQRLKRIDFSKLAGAPRCLDILKAWQRVQLKAKVIENNSTNDLDSEASAALNFLHNGRASSVNSNNNIASNFPSHYEGLMATCQDMDFDHDHDHPGDQAWNMGACNVGDHEDLDWIKGFSNLLFSDCEGDHLVQSNLDDYGNNGSNHDDENNNYWDDMFNLIDSGSGL